jgi:CBS-domain-containing membrane protein
VSDPEGAPGAPAATEAGPAASRLRLPSGLAGTLLAGLGGFAAIGVIALLGQVAATPLIIAPFGASCVLLFALPASPLAGPRNVIGGHVISALVGLAALNLLGPTPFAMAVGVGGAIVAMRLSGTLHPPAGANPIVMILAGAHWWFCLAPVALGAIVLVACAAVYHRFISGEAYALR